MKFYPCLLLLLVLPAAAQTYDYSKLSELAADPEKMRQEAEKMAKSFAGVQSCINDAGFKKMQADGQVMMENVKALCDKGDRDGAEKAVVEYSKKMAASEEFQKLQKCSEQLMAALPQSFVEAGKTQAAKIESEKPPHVCDIERAPPPTRGSSD